MNQDRFHGTCIQFRGALKVQWGRLSGDPRAVAAGKSDQFAGRILEQRGLSAQEAGRQLQDFMRRNRNWWDLSRR
jgi:uncharacterized protein YjbJ (UPF0337 family)